MPFLMPGHPFEETDIPILMPAIKIEQRQQTSRVVRRSVNKPTHHEKRNKETAFFGVFEPFQILYCQACKEIVPTNAVAIGLHLQSACYRMTPGAVIDEATMQARALLDTADDVNWIRRRGQLYTIAGRGDMILPEVPWLAEPTPGYFCRLCGQPKRARAVLREHMRRVHNGEKNMWGTTWVQSFRNAGNEFLTFRVVPRERGGRGEEKVGKGRATAGL